VSDRGKQVACLGDDMNVALALQQQPQVASPQAMIIGEHNPNRRRRRRARRTGGGWREVLGCGHAPKTSLARPPKRPGKRGTRVRIVLTILRKNTEVNINDSA